jgi:hypothetical protein
MVVVQELSIRDVTDHSTIAEHLIGIFANAIILMTDEAYFHLSHYVKKQNFHCWAEESPQQLHQWPVHSAHITFWCGVANFGVIGLISLKINEDVMKYM